MARKTNQQTALDHAARLGITIEADPRGSAILAQHDDDHSQCHWSADCTPLNCGNPDCCGACGTVPHSDGISAEFDNYFSACPVCGDPIDYCQGHGSIGDPIGAATLIMHDNNNHSACHHSADCHNN